jgi:hypothetical protein
VTSPPKLSEDELEKLSRTDNPTKGVTLILYDDDELREAFVGFEVMDLRRYEMGTRGLYLRKLASGNSGCDGRESIVTSVS